MNHQRDIFQPYLERRFKQASAITYGEKLQVIETLIAEVKEGSLPISADQVVRLNRDSAAVKAIREGQKISLDGRSEQRTTAATQTQTAKRNALIAIALLMLLPLGWGGWWFASANNSESEAVVTLATAAPTVTLPALQPPATATPRPTITPVPTFTPVDPRAFEVRVSNAEPLAAHNNPIALSLAGQEYRVTTAKEGALWQPEGIEWWPETHVRRVFALPYDDNLLTTLFAAIGQTATVRLRTGTAVPYLLEDIQRVHALQIEHLTANSPSIALVLYGEETSHERWLVTGRALQESYRPPDISLPTTETLDFLTIDHCTYQTDRQLICEVSATAAPYLAELQLTDVAWLEALAHLPPTHTAADEDNLTAQLVGRVRSPQTAVIAWRRGERTAVQLIDPSFIQIEEQGE